MSDKIALTALLLTPLFSAPLVYLVGRLICIARGKDEAPNPVWILALVCLLAACAPLYWVGKAVLANGSITIQRGAIPLTMDALGLLVSCVALGMGIVVVLFSVRYMAGEVNESKFYALLVAVVATMIGLSCAADLFNLWVWFEAMAIIGLLLVAFYREVPGSLEAGAKYLGQSALGSVLILIGIALVLMQTGQLNLDAIRVAVTGRSPLLLAAGALMIIGFGIKAALAPMHTWLPDAHSQAPSGISALLSGVLIETALVAMLRAVGSIAGSSASWGTILLGFAAINMLLGNLMALRQTEVKRMLAYSSISHVGYMLFGFGLAMRMGSVSGATGSLMHVITHAMMKGLAFLAAGSLVYALHLAKGHHDPLTLDDLNGAVRRYPIMVLFLAVAALGLGGLPPMAGFMSKWQIMVAGAETHSTLALAMVVFMALNSVLSLGYYAPLVARMVRKAPSAAVEAGERIPFVMVLPTAILAVGVVVVGMWPSLLSWLTGPAAAALMAAIGF